MAQVIVRNLDDDVAARLKQRAAQRGRSMEEEVRRILREAVRDELAAPKAGTRLASYFAGLGFVGPLPELRGEEPVPADFTRLSRRKAPRKS
jgi:plasmid stability protein